MTEQEANNAAQAQTNGFGGMQEANQQGNKARHVRESGQRGKHTGSKPAPLYPIKQKGK